MVLLFNGIGVHYIPVFVIRLFNALPQSGSNNILFKENNALQYE